MYASISSVDVEKSFWYKQIYCQIIIVDSHLKISGNNSLCSLMFKVKKFIIIKTFKHCIVFTLGLVRLDTEEDYKLNQLPFIN